MTKSLKVRGAGSSIGRVAAKNNEKLARKKETEKKRLTTVRESSNTSYKVTPISLRVSLTEKDATSEWVKDIEILSKRKLSPAKLFRALLKLREQISDQDIADLTDLMD